MLQDRLSGLSAALESSSVDKGRQQEMVAAMTKELGETQAFIEVRTATDYFMYVCACVRMCACVRA